MQHKTKFGLNVSVEIIRNNETDTAYVHVHAPMYMDKHWVMNHSYKSSAFSDHKILNDWDFVTVMSKHYK